MCQIWCLCHTLDDSCKNSTYLRCISMRPRNGKALLNIIVSSYYDVTNQQLMILNVIMLNDLEFCDFVVSLEYYVREVVSTANATR